MGLGSLGPEEQLGIGVAGREGVFLPLFDRDQTTGHQKPKRQDREQVCGITVQETARPLPPRNLPTPNGPSSLRLLAAPFDLCSAVPLRTFRPLQCPSPHFPLPFRTGSDPALPWSLPWCPLQERCLRPLGTPAHGTLSVPPARGVQCMSPHVSDSQIPTPQAWAQVSLIAVCAPSPGCLFNSR